MIPPLIALAAFGLFVAAILHEARALERAEADEPQEPSRP